MRIALDEILAKLYKILLFQMGAKNHPAGSIKLPKLVDISGDASKVARRFATESNIEVRNERRYKFFREAVSISDGEEGGAQRKYDVVHICIATYEIQREREFFLTTSLPFAAEENVAPLDLPRVETKYSWMKSGKTLKDLIALLQDKKIERAECEKLSLASLILVEGIILSRYTAKIIATSSLQEALNFEDYIRKPWGMIGFEFLRTQILKMYAESWTKETHAFEGFGTQELTDRILQLCRFPLLAS
ncbi:hypothetical protein F2Q70_00039870 [Brassica cretica]|uniref:DUF1985 domain-containing protein n=1 Tax=Brassica cretica TaxID=69181 RepID=A0A8S9KB99_BRACR|nr:hypothetical protein F2Q70_00039870 [Brassica cretica]